MTCTPSVFNAVREALEKASIATLSAGVVMAPQNVVHLDGKRAHQCVKLLEALEDQEDVQHVYANLEFDEADLEAEVS